MDIKELLIYKTDEKTGRQRVSKTKVIPLTLFIVFFLFSFVYYLVTPGISPNILVSIIAAIIIGAMPAVPAFIIGFILSKILNRNNSQPGTRQPLQQNNQIPQQNKRIPQQNNQIPQQNNQVPQQENKIPEQDTNKNTQPENVDPCPHDNATRFMNAITENNSDMAAEILSKWNESDANYLYAKIIYEGMPPTDVTTNELNTWLKNADNTRSCDENLRTWYRDNAVKVINLHN